VTTPTPQLIRHTYAADVDTPAGRYPLDVSNIVVTLSEDDTAYVSATVTCAWVSEEVWALMDPRAGHYLRWKVDQWADVNATQLVGTLPGERWEDAGEYARMVITERDRDHLTRTVTLTCESRESLLADKIRNATTTVDTGATTVAALVNWSLADVFGGEVGPTAWAAIMASTAIPSGDRRVMKQGDTHFDLIRAELDAIAVRIYDLFGQVWGASLRNSVSGRPPLRLATHDWADGAPADADPIVFALTERTSRRDWADGVLIKYDLTASGGSVSYQRSGAGANTKGRVITRTRPAPADNAADALVTRTKQRGHTFTVTARARVTDVHTRAPIEILTRQGTLAGVIRTVRWDFAAAEMTITAQTGTDV